MYVLPYVSPSLCTSLLYTYSPCLFPSVFLFHLLVYICFSFMSFYILVPSLCEHPLRVYVLLYVCSFVYLSFYVYVLPDVNLAMSMFLQVYVSCIHSTMYTFHRVYTPSGLYSIWCTLPCIQSIGCILYHTLEIWH